MPLKQAVHYLITGKVQGVFYRAGTKRKAKQLHITGWVRNLKNGCVEVLAIGSKEQHQAFFSWLKKGSLLSKVEHVLQTPQSQQKVQDDFIILKNAE